MNIDFMIDTFFHTLTGIPVTLKLTFIPLLLAAPIAFLMAIAKIKRLKSTSFIINLYVSFIRGTPMVLQILIFYSLLPSVLNAIVKSIDLNINVFDINPIIYAYTVFTLNTIAALTECFRSALLTVSKGQLEAARSIGLTGFQAYVRIIIPQALVSAMQNICNITMNLIKGTSLAFLMTVQDITAIAKMDAAYGYNYIEAYVVIFIVYIIVCLTIQGLFHLIEKYFGRFKNTQLKKGDLKYVGN